MKKPRFDKAIPITFITGAMIGMSGLSGMMLFGSLRIGMITIGILCLWMIVLASMITISIATEP